MYNQNFLETPDPATGLQRRTGQNFLDHKQTLHERLVLEHNLDTIAASPQTDHGTHRQGSAKMYVLAPDEDLPLDRPTGKDKTGVNDIPAIPLNADDRGRLAYKEEDGLYYYKDETDTWQRIDTNPIGFIQIWPSPFTPPPPQWLKCDGTDTYTIDDYPELFALLGDTYGGDGVTTFAVPDLQGVSIVGSGSLDFPDGGDPTGSPTGRMKGGGTLGTYLEDNIQEFGGHFAGHEVYGDENFFSSFSGIFEEYSDPTNRDRLVDRTNSGEQNLKGVQVNLDLMDIRRGDETRATALVIDYYIKAR